jgi:hypothetical protein
VCCLASNLFQVVRTLLREAVCLVDNYQNLKTFVFCPALHDSHTRASPEVDSLGVLPKTLVLGSEPNFGSSLTLLFVSKWLNAIGQRDAPCLPPPILAYQLRPKVGEVLTPILIALSRSQGFSKHSYGLYKSSKGLYIILTAFKSYLTVSMNS